VILGRVLDVFGRNNCLAASLLLAACGNLIAVLIADPLGFYIARGLCGVGSAGMHSLTILILADVVPRNERARFQGYIGVALSVGDFCGPLVMCSALATVGSMWFYVGMCCLCTLVGVSAIFTLPHQKTRVTYGEFFRQFDYYGFILIVVFLISLILTLINIGDNWPISEWNTWLYVLIPNVLLVAFVYAEYRNDEFALIPMRLLTGSHSTLGISLCVCFFYGFVFTSMQYFIPFYFTTIRGITLFTVSKMTFTMALPLFIASYISGTMVKKFGYKRVLSAGFSIWAYSMIALYVMLGKSIVCDSFVLCLIGVSVGLVLQPSIVGIQAQALRVDRSVAVTTRNVLKSIGGAIGIAMTSMVYNQSLQFGIMDSATLSVETRRFVLSNLKAKLGHIVEIDRPEVFHCYMQSFHYVLFLWFMMLSVCRGLNGYVQNRGLLSVDESTLYERVMSPVMKEASTVDRGTLEKTV
jgi:MFS family permease